MEQNQIISKQFWSKILTELQYVERNFFMKEVNTQNFWTFEWGTQESINVPIWIIVGFHRRNRQESQSWNDDTFYRPSVRSGKGLIGTEKYPDTSILLNNDDDDYLQECGQYKETFRPLAKHDIPKPFILDLVYRSTNVNDGVEIDNTVGYNLYVCDKR